VTKIEYKIAHQGGAGNENDWGYKLHFKDGTTFSFNDPVKTNSNTTMDANWSVIFGYVSDS